MKQTAVEWLAEQLEIDIKLDEGWYDALEKAKQMEKQQIMNAWDEVGCEWADNSEQYYNETYGKDEESD